MADSYLERVAGEIADLAIADEKASGDIRIVDEIAKVLGSSSQTLEEAFLTAVRVRKAEARARAVLAKRAADGYAHMIKSDSDTISSGPTEEDAEDDAETPDKDDATPTADEKDVTEEAMEKLKRSGIGMSRRVQR